MKKLGSIAIVLALAGFAHGFQLGMTETGLVDNGGSFTSTIEIWVDLEGAPDVDTVTALGLGSIDAPGVMTLDSYVGAIPGWAAWSIIPPAGYVIGTTDLVDPYNVQMIVDGYHLGGFGGLAVGSPVLLGTATITHPGGVTLTVSAADMASSDFSAYETNLYFTIPEPGTALLLLAGGFLALIRRR